MTSIPTGATTSSADRNQSASKEVPTSYEIWSRAEEMYTPSDRMVQEVVALRAQKASQTLRPSIRDRGITQENWLQHLDTMSDEEITYMLDREPGKARLDEERKANPSITDRIWAETLRDF